MLIKKTNGKISYVKEGVKGLIILEIGFFIGSYVAWNRMNRSQDFRLYMYKEFPKTLDWFYYIGESLSKDNQTRSQDLETWKSQHKLSS